MRFPDRRTLWALLLAALLAGAGLSSPVRAQAIDAAVLQELQQEMQAQRKLIEQQAARIDAQQQEIDRLRTGMISSVALATLRGGGVGQAGPVPTSPVAPIPSAASADPLPDQPVGTDPGLPEVEAQVQAVPEGQGVLTGRGRFVFEPSIEYTNSSSNRLVFRGIELIPGIQIGVIEASDADRDTFIGTLTGRYGLTNRLELEARVPYLARSDRIEVVQQRDGQIVRQLNLKENDIGDIEVAARYQFNRPVGQQPIFVGSLRVKSNTGRGPFEVPFDEFGIATGLATGSGFWAVQPGLNFLLPSDPAVIFGGASYLYHMPRNIDRLIGDVFVGRVDPGDAISANLGFGFALNPRFSYSLGYRHNYILPTDSEIGETVQRSRSLQVGSVALGMSYRLGERQTLNFGVEFGVTEDAPDVSLTLRVPTRF